MVVRRMLTGPREGISRGVAPDEQGKMIAARIGRSPSVVSPLHDSRVGYHAIGPGRRPAVHREILRRVGQFGPAHSAEPADNSNFRQLEQEVPSWEIARSAGW